MSRKSSHYVVFGVGDTPNKAVIVGKSPRLSGYECNIVGLDNNGKYAIGDTIEAEDVESLWTTLYFTKLESLKAFANVLNEAIRRWEEEEK